MWYLWLIGGVLLGFILGGGLVRAGMQQRILEWRSTAHYYQGRTMYLKRILESQNITIPPGDVQPWSGGTA